MNIHILIAGAVTPRLCITRNHLGISEQLRLKKPYLERMPTQIGTQKQLKLDAMAIG